MNIGILRERAAFDRRVALECERGGPVELVLSMEPKDQDKVVDYAFRQAQEGACPVR